MGAVCYSASAASKRGESYIATSVTSPEYREPTVEEDMNGFWEEEEREVA